jgi:hypothetical protein
MSVIQKYLNAENRRKILNYLRPSQYNFHPELKVTSIPNKRWKMLMTMRDLRLWIEENATFSSRAKLYKGELYHINEELNYLQFRAMILPFLLFAGVSIWFTYWAPRQWRGHLTTNNRPV